MQGLDDRDIKILTILQTDGRITKAALAEKVNLSPAACWTRLQRLEDQGVLAGYEARLNPMAIATFAEVMMTVELEDHTHECQSRFEAGVQDFPEIVDCWSTGGGIDYLVRVVASDIATYQEVVERMLQAGLGIKRYYTYVVTKPVKHAPLAPSLLKSALSKT